MSSVKPAPFKVLDVELMAEQAIDGRKVLEEVIPILRPEWPRDSIHVQPLSGGLVNTLVCFHLVEDTRMTDAIVFRVLFPLPPNFEGTDCAFHRDEEFLALQLAAHAGVATEVLATFNNGWVYRLARGRIITGSELHHPPVIRAVARAMAQLHSVDLDTPLYDRQGRPISYPKNHSFFKLTINNFSNAPDQLLDPQEDARYEAECRPRQAWLDDYRDMESLFSRLNIPCALIHVDLHGKNIIYDDEHERVHLIDYEFSSYGPAAFDLRGCFLDYDIRQLIPDFRDENELPFTEDIVNMWMTEYLRQKRQLRGLESPDVTENDVKKLKLECRFIELLNYMHWALVAPALMSFKESLGWPMFDIIKLCETKRDELKPEMPLLEAEYVKLLKTTS